MIRGLFRERPLRMAWEVRRGGLKGFLVGTAHFFPYRYLRYERDRADGLDRLLERL